MERKNEKEHLPPKNGTGRLSNTGEENSSPAQAEGQQRDISHMDQQEGEMEHGELGGNLNEKLSQDSEN
jgi:hypothetical protein